MRHARLCSNAELGTDEVSCRDQLVHLYSGNVAHTVQQIQQILCSYIAHRAGCIRATSQPAHGSIESTDAILQTRIDVGERLPIRIVKVTGNVRPGHLRRNITEQSQRLLRRATADRVAP